MRNLNIVIMICFLVKLLKTTTTYACWTITSLVLSIPCLLISLLPEKIRPNKLYFSITYLWNVILIKATFIPLKISGTYQKEPSIYVINHRSALDIPIVEIVIGPNKHIWISKKEYGKIPIFGILLRRMHVLIDRYSPMNAARSLVKVCALARKRKSHILIFPEGTRSKNGTAFLTGFALLARKLNRPVVPIVIKGSGDAYSKESYLINSSGHLKTCLLKTCLLKASLLHAEIGEPFIMLKEESDKEFTRRVEDWFKHVLKI